MKRLMWMAGVALAAQTAELTGNVGYETAIARNVVITVGDGGSGRYPAILRGDPGLVTHAIYRPRDLAAFGGSRKLPVVAWGNGACRNSSGEYRNFLTEIASHGYLVVAIGPAAVSAISGNDLPGSTTKTAQLWDGVDWLVAEGARQGSEYFGKVDGGKVAVMGHSCGGLQALEASLDPRVTTTVLWNSGVLPVARPGMPAVGKDILGKLRAPVAYFIGGKRDIAYANAMDDFQKIQGVPMFMANRDVGHYPATFREARGGAFAAAGVAWLDWQLKGDAAARAMFVGSECGLCRDPKWTVDGWRNFN